MQKTGLVKALMVIMGAIFIITGFMTFKYPLETMVSAALFLGVSIFVAGIFYMVAYFKEKSLLPNPGWLLLQGILDILVGILLLSNIGVTTASLPYIMGFWAMFVGVNRIVFSFDLKKVGVNKWWLALITGIFSLLLAVLIIFYPLFGAAFVVAYIAVFLIYYGFMAIVEAFMIK